jgi:FkbM family methyltransferase
MEIEPLPEKPRTISAEQRAQLTISCKDCDPIPKHPLAGQQSLDDDGTKWQIMHNGLAVEYGGYHGEWMARIIRELRGHHEPQEEMVFHLVLQRLREQPNMIELGAYWAYYSLWFKKCFPLGKAHMFEPDAAHLDLGKRNFRRDGFDGYFENVAGGLDANGKFYCETAGEWREIASKSVDTICAEQNIEFLDVLHIDIQGFELNALVGAQKMIAQKRVRFVCVSTHHHCISADPLTHQRCVHWLEKTGAHIVCEHSVLESFSGDGMIVASYAPEDSMWKVDVSRARASNNLFRELEYDLAELMQKPS